MLHGTAHPETPTRSPNTSAGRDERVPVATHTAHCHGFCQESTMKWTRVLGLLAAFSLSATATAQSGPGRISGTVTEAESGQPIPDVNISVANTTIGAHSGPDGKFLIPSIAPGR